MWIVLYALIILSTVLVLPVGESYWFPKNAIFVVLALILIGSSWLTRNKERTTFYSPFLSIFLIFFALHIGWFFLKPLVFNDARGQIIWNLWMIMPIINVILGIFMVNVLVEYTDSYQRWINTAKVLIWLGFGLSIFAILQFFGLEQVFKDTKNVLPGNSVCLFFGQPMLAGHFLAIISPLALIFKKPRYIVIYLIMLVAIYCTDSASALGIAIVSLIVFLFLNKKWKWSLSLMGSISVIYLLMWRYRPIYFDLGDRPELWKGAFKFCREAMLSGSGLGSWATRGFNPVEGIISWAHTTHNEPIQLLHDFGIIGLGIALCYIIHLFKRLFYQNNSMLLCGYLSAFIGYLLVCLIGFPLRIAPLALIGILYISCLEVHCSEVRRI